MVTSEGLVEKFIYKIAEDNKEIEDYFRLRHDIFVKEQNIFSETDIDKYDTDPFHKVINIISVKQPDGKIIGAVRCYRKEGDTWVGGRLSVARGYRTGRVGAGLVRFAVESMKSRDCKKFLAYVQPQNVRFFIRLGWTPIGEPETYQGSPHQLMEADLNSA